MAWGQVAEPRDRCGSTYLRTDADTTTNANCTSASVGASTTTYTYDRAIGRTAHWPSEQVQEMSKTLLKHC